LLLGHWSGGSVLAGHGGGWGCLGKVREYEK
jgi:hypothetical protein